MPSLFYHLYSLFTITFSHPFQGGVADYDARSIRRGGYYLHLFQSVSIYFLKFLSSINQAYIQTSNIVNQTSPRPNIEHPNSSSIFQILTFSNFQPSLSFPESVADHEAQIIRRGGNYLYLSQSVSIYFPKFLSPNNQVTPISKHRT
ncbi:hypothetical protein DMA11_24015 [Marinilabiliaceae bacterium JC017]|nr:hypothetical protein DMA11_24015 [Marinilabiliaceae bacterium JC017]